MAVESADETRSVSTGRRVWMWAAICISVVVLILAVAGIGGTWVARSVAINVATGVLEGIDHLAGVGREGAVLLDGGVAEVRSIVGSVEEAVGQIAEDVSDKGLVLTLLSPEKEQRLVEAAERVGETLDTFRSVIQAVIELVDAIDSIPFVNLPKPDPAELEELEADVQSVRDGVDQLASDIQAFRDGVASEISTVSDGAGRINSRLEETQEDLARIDGKLSDVQERANQLVGTVRIWATIIAIVLTLVLGWVGYGMVKLIRGNWAEVRTG